MSGPAPIHVPGAEAVERAQLTSFARACALRTGLALDGWEALYAFSVARPRDFWHFFVEWSGIATEGELAPVCVGEEVEHARFFPGLRLNYA